MSRMPGDEPGLRVPPLLLTSPLTVPTPPSVPPRRSIALAALRVPPWRVVVPPVWTYLLLLGSAERGTEKVLPGPTTRLPWLVKGVVAVKFRPLVMEKLLEPALVAKLARGLVVPVGAL